MANSSYIAADKVAKPVMEYVRSMSKPAEPENPYTFFFNSDSRFQEVT
jgi:hypothetical protein